jgi:hypothetical protein
MCKSSFAHAQLSSNLFVQGMVWRLKVKCRQSEDGCKWTGELGIDGRNLKAHDASCSFKTVSCSQCEQEVKRADLPKHPFECPERECHMLGVREP